MRPLKHVYENLDLQGKHSSYHNSLQEAKYAVKGLTGVPCLLVRQYTLLESYSVQEADLWATYDQNGDVWADEWLPRLIADLFDMDITLTTGIFPFTETYTRVLVDAVAESEKA